MHVILFSNKTSFFILFSCFGCIWINELSDVVQLFYSNWQRHHVNVVRTCLLVVCLVQLATYQKIERKKMHHFMRHKLKQTTCSSKGQIFNGFITKVKAELLKSRLYNFYSTTYWLRDGKVMNKATGCLFFQPTLYELF